MQGLRKGEWSAITKVKVLSPEICLIALGQGLIHSEASIATHDNGECDSGVPGSARKSTTPWVNNKPPIGGLQVQFYFFFDISSHKIIHCVENIKS